MPFSRKRVTTHWTTCFHFTLQCMAAQPEGSNVQPVLLLAPVRTLVLYLLVSQQEWIWLVLYDRRIVRPITFQVLPPLYKHLHGLFIVWYKTPHLACHFKQTFALKHRSSINDKNTESEFTKEDILSLLLVVVVVCLASNTEYFWSRGLWIIPAVCLSSKYTELFLI